MLASAALVLLMTPGLAFFYGGMVRAKNVLNMLMMNFICLAVVGVLWTFYGFSWSFGAPRWSGLIGSSSNFYGLGKPGVLGSIWAFGPVYAIGEKLPDGTAAAGLGVPVVVFAMFQLMFAMITPALISGAIADRVKFWGWTLFVGLWVTLVYFPVANWVFGTGWILNKLRAEDFAGGTAVHINAGAAALALVFVLGKRAGWRRDPMKPHNVPFVLLGASLLWFGWYGFNAGSEGGADQTAGLAFTTTTIATCAATLGWLLVEQIRDGKPTTVGAASGAVAGLVAITPACAFVSPLGGMAIGLIAGILCALAVGLKFRFGFDDALDVVGVHLVGGLTGTILIGFFGFDHGALAGGVESKRGLFYGGGLKLLWVQLIAAGSVLAYSFIVTFIIGTVLKAMGIFRVSEEAEAMGLDEAEHAESAYSFSTVLSGGLSHVPGSSAGTVPSELTGKGV
ncbi:ammonium transporter [Jatrophihabitans telluris]|uniref:Ammonium transporter n=1 Tax=Jatrophihabitans telluris TaxID=2038343 RepID=A0ABY4R3M4_9ACTN|nr:ammonium transporter [Jatrophihabitans telluris]UQX89983.1 ammonium transporter [Jatrophihabitans telluris]